MTIVGGWAWAWWLVTDVQRLSLEVMTLNPMCGNVETAQGVPLTVTGVAQCKIMKADELLYTASEQFLGKSVKEIKSTILQTLEGHLRAILGEFCNFYKIKISDNYCNFYKNQRDLIVFSNLSLDLLYSFFVICTF